MTLRHWLLHFFVDFEFSILDLEDLKESFLANNPFSRLLEKKHLVLYRFGFKNEPFKKLALVKDALVNLVF